MCASADPVQRDEVTHLLANDFEVIGVPDGVVALQVAHEHLLELVISDVAMPRVDGTALLVALRADPRTSSIPVLFLAEPASAAAPHDGVAPQPDGYLVRPFTAPDLVECLDRHITLSQTRRAWALVREHAAWELAGGDHAQRRQATLEVPPCSPRCSAASSGESCST